MQKVLRGQRMARGLNKPASHDKKPQKSSRLNQAGTSSQTSSSQPSSSVPPELHQKCLDLFRDAFNPSRQDNETLQEVKGHLYNREFSLAFGKEDYLRVYASRWSPSRALAYMQVLTDIENHLTGNAHREQDHNYRIVCLGGGAGGELVGFSGWSAFRKVHVSSNPNKRLQISQVDIADWSNVVHALEERITTPPELSKYASQVRRDANNPLLERDDVDISFERLDLLDQADETDHILSRLFERADLVTFMFTLNELYTASMPKAQKLLSRITDSIQPGSFLLIVDSPGSYSIVSINGAEKRYPMQWLLDYTLLGPSAEKDMKLPAARWEKVVSDASRWFRLSKKLQYPIDLEDMRYQIHLYRRLGK